MAIIGFLAPDGKFQSCSSFEHLDMAAHICKTITKSVYGKDVDLVQCFEFERYLLDIGYVMFRARDIGYAQWCSKEYCDSLNLPDDSYVNSLTSKQIAFINKCNDNLTWNNSDQIESMYKILEYDKDIKQGIKDNELKLNPCLKRVDNMSKQDKEQLIRECQDEANTAKERLMNIVYKLEEGGAIRQAKSLETIIEKLETWQHK